MGRWGVYPVQGLDGIGTGLQSVAVPGLVARSGASFSPAIGGWMAQEIGCSPMFLILGSFAPSSMALWIGFASVLKPACARRGHSEERRIATALAGAR
jgi:hypothetical protein